MTDPHPAVPDGAERARTVTFTGADLTTMLTLTETGDVLRLDGWLAPASSTRVELIAANGTVHVEHSDEDGRFAFTGVPAGPLRLVVHPPDEGPALLRTAVVTPAVQL